MRLTKHKAYSRLPPTISSSEDEEWAEFDTILTGLGTLEAGCMMAGTLAASSPPLRHFGRESRVGRGSQLQQLANDIMRHFTALEQEHLGTSVLAVLSASVVQTTVKAAQTLHVALEIQMQLLMVDTCESLMEVSPKPAGYNEVTWKTR